MTTFSPPNGSVFDPFGHGMTTPCAALISGRPCTALQVDSEVFQMGVRRLSYILEAGNISKKFRSQDMQNRERTRSMFEIYEKNRTRTCRTRAPDVSNSNVDFPVMSPVKPKFAPGKTKCHVDGCLLAEQSNDTGVSNQMYGHSCNLCGANVHVFCCQRILKIEVEDDETALFCSNCYLK